MREAKEETSLDVMLLRQFHTYSEPDRDPRKHTVSVVFIAKAFAGSLQADDDAKDAHWFKGGDLPKEMAFDHRQIIEDYLGKKY